MATYALLALLNPRQQFMVDKMATMAIRESSDMDASTDDDMELRQENMEDALDLGKRTITSRNNVDK